MVKSYLRYELDKTFGVVAAPGSNVVYDSTGKLVVASALEDLVVWNLRQSVKVQHLSAEDNRAEVTVIERSPDQKTVAVGYSDGRVRIWDVTKGTCLLTLNGHRSAISALRFNAEGSLLVSGSQDTDCIVWDPVSESGLYRLRGHKGEVTDVRFLEKGQHRHLITASKDTFVKIWDLDTQHCVQTLVGHRKEVWSFDVNAQETLLVTGSQDKFLRVWRLKGGEGGEPMQGKGGEGANGGDGLQALRMAEQWGQIERKGNKRVSRVRFNAQQSLLACQSAGKVVDMWQVTSDANVNKRCKRRAKRVREKAQKQPDKYTKDELAEAQAQALLPLPADRFALMPPLRTKKKVSSMAWSPVAAGKHGAHLLLGMNDNSLSAYDVRLTEEHKLEPSTRTQQLLLPGHRAGVRCVSLSHDDALLLSCSSNQAKVWNTDSQKCIRTMDTGYGLCGLFVPGARHIIIGTKEGELELWELASGKCLQRIAAHEGPVWSIDVRADKKGLVSGGADKNVMCWDFTLDIPEPEEGEEPITTRVLQLVHTRTLRLTEDVLCLKYTPDGRYLCVGLLDCTVKIFFADTFKFFLSLYGHKLPVTTLDVSSDSTLLATGSADKNVKLWGLDFGDCHKSLFAHQDSVMQVRFVPGTHYFVSVGKDKLCKFWDGDKFEHVMTLSGHHAEVWGLAVGHTGQLLVTSSNDRSIRLWEQTQEPVFIEEERENRMMELYDEGAQTEAQRVGEVDGSGLVPASEGESAAVARAKATNSSLMAGERLMEAIDVALGEQERWDNYHKAVREVEEKARRPQQKMSGLYKALGEMAGNEGPTKASDIPKPARNVLLLGSSAEEHVLRVMKSIRRSELEEAMMVLPFNHACHLLRFLDAFLAKGWDVELAVRCMLFLVGLHHAQLVSNQVLLPQLSRARKHARERLERLRDQVGYNVAGLKFVHQLVKDNTNAYFFGDAAERPKKKQRS